RWRPRSPRGFPACRGPGHAESCRRAWPTEPRTRAMTRFTKGHGLGNDYLVMEERDVTFPFGPAAVRWICHRNWGVGSDGILLRTGSGVADVGLRIFNPDGSEAEKSGNGLRIFAKYLWERGGLQKSPMRIETKGGVVEAVCHLVGGRVDEVTV